MAILELKIVERESKPPTTITVQGQQSLLTLFLQMVKDFNEKYVNGDFYIDEDGEIAFKPGRRNGG